MASMHLQLRHEIWSPQSCKDTGAEHEHCACVLTPASAPTQGYMLQNAPNVYLTALAMAALPNTVGYVVGPLLTAVGVYFASRSQRNSGVGDERDVLDDREQLKS